MMLDFGSVMLMIGGDVGFWVGDADDWWILCR